MMSNSESSLSPLYAFIINMRVTDVPIPALICDLVVRSFPGAIEAHEVVNEVKFSIVPSPPAAFIK
jgi:hypothetical protein